MIMLDLDRPAWMADAACRLMDVEVFFPPAGDTPGLKAAALIAEAKAVCARCDVQVECLAYALSAGERDGIWGGFDERERRAIRAGKARRPRPSRAEHGTISGYHRHYLDGTPPLPAVSRRPRQVPADDPPVAGEMRAS